jgi:hypothetical protein
MSGVNVTQPGKRMVFKAAVDEMTAAGVSTQRAVLTQSELRTEIPLTTGSTQFTIPMLVNQNGPNGIQFNSEKRLALQDAFVAGSMSIRLAAPTSTADYTFEMYSYPSLAVFSAAQALALQVIYNGWLSLIVDQKVLTPYWSVDKHFKVNQTQAATAPYTAGARDQTDHSCDGFFPIEPNWVFIGNTNINYQLNLPAAISTLLAGTRLIIVHEGVYAQNATKLGNT